MSFKLLQENKIGNGENFVLSISTKKITDIQYESYPNIIGYISKIGIIDPIRATIINSFRDKDDKYVSKHDRYQYTNSSVKNIVSKINNISKILQEDENFYLNFLNTIAYQNNYSLTKEDIFFNLLKDNINEYSKFDFLEKLGNVDLNEYNFYYLDEEYIYIFTLVNNEYLLSHNDKDLINNFIAFKTKVNHEESDIVEMLDKGYAPALIYFYEMYKEEKKNNNEFYYTFNIQEPHKIRKIYAPNDNIKKACKILLRPLNEAFDTRRKKYGEYSAQFAYIKGKSILDNANYHKENNYEIRFDLKSFFDSCKYNYWKKYTKFLFPPYIHYGSNLYYDVENALKEVLVNPETGGLYMGNPVSGVLSNMIMHPVMIYLKNILQKELNLNYTDGKYIDCSIYADDLTFSTINAYDLKEFSVKYLSNLINHCLKYYGLTEMKLKPEKTLKNRNQTRKVTGLRINHLNQVTVERYKYNDMKVMCYYISQGKKISIPLTEFAGKLSFYIHNDETGKFLKLAKKFKDDFIRVGINKRLPKIIFEE